jgi:protease-4
MMLLEKMMQAEASEGVIGHLFIIDSGGGQGDYLQTLAACIKSDIKKPVVAWVNGTCASAAYWIAACADEIYANEDTNMIGSIGVLNRFVDMKGLLEKMGITEYETYADQSDLKNKEVRDIREGDDKEMKALVNPWAKSFIALVKEVRPQLNAEEAFRGKIYMANEAKVIGMIDDVKPKGHAIMRVYELAKERQQTEVSTQNQLDMKKLESVLGGPMEIHNGGAFLSKEQLDMIDAAMLAEDQVPVPQADFTAMRKQLDKLQSEFDAHKQSAETSQQGLTERVEKLETGAGAPPTDAFATEDPGTPKEEDELDKFEAQAREAAKVGLVSFEPAPKKYD